MRVLHVVSTLEAGGIASSLRHILPSLARCPDIQVEIATQYKGGYFAEGLGQDGIPIHSLHAPHKYSAGAAYRLARLIHTRHYDVVHVHGWPVNLFTAAISLLLRHPCYLCGEHNVTSRRRRPFFRPLDRLLYSRYQRVIAVSRAVAAALQRWLPQTAQKTEVVYNGIEPDFLETTAVDRKQLVASLDLSHAVPLVLNGGGLEYKKGVDVLLRALDYIRLAPQVPAQPNTLIAGDGPQRPLLQKLTRELGLHEQVRFLGFRTDLPAVMAAADLFVISSRWEGCPMVVLEAMFQAKPIVATAVGGIPELIENGVEGLLTAPAEPRALAEAMVELLSGNPRAALLGEAARRRVLAEFQARDAAQNLANIYTQVLS